MICGMNTFAYWVINIFFDLFKIEFIVGLCASLLFAFGLREYYQALYIFLLWPVGVVPFTHATSFLFTTEWAA